MPNFKKFLNKKIIFIFVIFLILTVGGLFFWWQGRETPIEEWETAEVSLEKDYITKETPQGIVVENKKMGLIYEIPKDWILANGNPSRFYSPDAEFREKRSDILEKGCKVYVYASYIKTNLDTLVKFLNDNFSQLSSVVRIDDSIEIEVSGFPALRHEYNIENLKMAYVSVDFPARNKLYKILLSNSIKDKEKCLFEFDKFLETISINPDGKIF